MITTVTAQSYRLPGDGAVSFPLDQSERTPPLFTAIAKSPVTARFYAVGRAASACFGEQRRRRGNAFGQLGRTPCARQIAGGGFMRFPARTSSDPRCRGKQ